MALLRTKLLGNRSSEPAGTSHTIYTCPPGHRAVIRDVRLTNSGAADAGIVYLSLAHSGGSGVWLYVGTFAHSTVKELQGDIVLEEGDTLAVYADVGTILVWASGAELPLAPD